MEQRANAVLRMCERCIKIDATIERDRRLAAAITDRSTLDALKKLTEQLNAEKVALHPEQAK
jgi:hypothetical protein